MLENLYKPLAERIPDKQYRDRLWTVVREGVFVPSTDQGIGALTCFATLSPMVFDPRNGVPLITERNMSFWKQSIAEILCFINGVRIIDEIEKYGCKFWNDYKGRGSDFGLPPNDLGPGSYGAAFHDFESPDGRVVNQFAEIVKQIRERPYQRTLVVTPWKPYYTFPGKHRKVIVAPCHGWIFLRILEEQLILCMVQRSADLPLGIPSNMFQYMALLLMLCQVTGYEPGYMSHELIDAHIYEDQLPAVKEMLTRRQRPFPILRLDPSVKNIFDFRIEHFSLEEYDPHPGIKIPYRP